MSRKVYIKPPPRARAMFVALIVISALSLVFGIGLFIGVQEELGEARPFVAFFFLIWSVACIAMIVHAIKALRMMKKGKIEIAEVSGAAGVTESDFAARLRDLEGLKKDGLLSEEEYQRKRAEIMDEKW
ncbi:MAG: SHOCT domain-containing protein [Desulfobacterales bacterium]|nr:SHOCT domain-containing protein [Desulfobacterales bacterium]